MLLTYEGRGYELRPGESVLEGMARHGIGLPSACRAGLCQACVVRAVAGDPGPDARRGLKETWLASGYFLACLARPSADLTVAQAGADTQMAATLAGVSRLGSGQPGAGVLRVIVRPERPLDFRAGQHVTLTARGVTRIYSIASLPAQARRDGIEFHVREFPGGAMSGWLAAAAPGSAMTIGCPAGDCFCTPGLERAPLLLAGTGTGIAPLIAIARSALAEGHTGPITIIHGSADPGGLYLGTGRPAALAGAAGASVTWRTTVLSRGEDIADAALQEAARLRELPGALRAFLCGGPGSVRRMRRALFLAGTPLRDIFADLFTAAADCR
jgi:CDP-4-dehydro-6-deoxyglucose reductase, E3